jgi:hypothetical protein
VPTGLLEPRLYRAAFVPALLTLIVLAFSLKEPPRALTPELAPPTFSAQRALATARQLTDAYGARESGGRQDAAVAALVRARLSENGFVTSDYRFRARTLNGRRTLANVVGVRAGPSDRRLVIVASRDGSRGALAGAGAVETGMLLEFARVLQGRSFGHTLVLASVSGGADGGLGAAELARRLRRPVDAVIALRNVAASQRDGAVLSVYDSRLDPDARLVRTVERLAALEFGTSGGGFSTAGQLVRMGFPLALGEQAVFPERGLAAVAVSPGGESLAPPQPAPAPLVAATARTALRALTTFDDGFRPADPEPAELRLGGKLIPGWALILFTGALLLPLVVVSVDGWARARRRQETASRGLVAAPLALAWLVLLVLLLRALGAVGALNAPPLPAEPRALSGVAPVAVGLLVLALAPAGLLVAAASARHLTVRGGASGFALWIVVAGIAVFAVNPIAALFWVPLLHLLVLLLLAGTRPRRAQVWLTALVGGLPLFAAAVYYPVALSMGPLDSLRFAVLLQAGGFVGPLATVGDCLIVAAVFVALLQLHWTAPPRRQILNSTVGQN